METTLLVLSLVLIIVMLLTIIFVSLRCRNYRKAWLHQIHAMHKIVEAEDTFQEALGIMMAVYQLPEDEVIRRLMT